MAETAGPMVLHSNCESVTPRTCNRDRRTCGCRAGCEGLLVEDAGAGCAGLLGAAGNGLASAGRQMHHSSAISQLVQRADSYYKNMVTQKAQAVMFAHRFGGPGHTVLKHKKSVVAPNVYFGRCWMFMQRAAASSVELGQRTTSIAKNAVPKIWRSKNAIVTDHVSNGLQTWKKGAGRTKFRANCADFCTEGISKIKLANMQQCTFGDRFSFFFWRRHPEARKRKDCDFLRFSVFFGTFWSFKEFSVKAAQHTHTVLQLVLGFQTGTNILRQIPFPAFCRRHPCRRH